MRASAFDVKVIVNGSSLTDEQLREACKLAIREAVDEFNQQWLLGGQDAFVPTGLFTATG